ncbi:hypothetical protein [Humibacter sp.]|uniref:hypothetical protein n=1 Tax=Humibacter sp. TaxID=1940291 RepID=UPI003F7DA9EC
MSRASQISLIGFGVVVSAFGAALLWRATAVHPVDVTLVRVSAGIFGVGLLLIAPGALAAGVKRVGSAAADAWRAKSAGKP